MCNSWQKTFAIYRKSDVAKFHKNDAFFPRPRGACGRESNPGQAGPLCRRSGNSIGRPAVIACRAIRDLRPCRRNRCKLLGLRSRSSWCFTSPPIARPCAPKRESCLKQPRAANPRGSPGSEVTCAASFSFRRPLEVGPQLGASAEWLGCVEHASYAADSCPCTVALFSVLQIVGGDWAARSTVASASSVGKRSPR